MPPRWRPALALAVLVCVAGCSGPRPAPPSILLVTLDTTRADALGPDAKGVSTPAFNALVERGFRFRQAYAAVPETLPSHVSIMTGLYPAGHGIHENGRTLDASFPVIAERLHGSGYRTSAFVSAFVLARQFGLSRGFDIYDDTMPEGRQERSARETTDRALADLAADGSQPRFMWVHYYDPHFPYTPPEPYRSQYPASPYLGEVAAMDHELGRLVEAFDARTGRHGVIIVAADHGEGLGDHGEAQHGTLLYQPTMHVPLVIAGEGVRQGGSDAPVSTRAIFYTALDLAHLATSDLSLHSSPGQSGVVIGEAMKPFLEYGWQPQVMSIAGHYKGIEAGKLEAYDVVADPGESQDLGAGANLPHELRRGLDDYPLPSLKVRAADTLDAEARARLAALGYVSASVPPVVRKDAPRPVDRVGLLPSIERASGLFSAGKYAEAIPVLEAIRASDPGNLDATLRLAVSQSSLGHAAQAEALFQQAAALAPDSPDVRVYLGLHYARTPDWARAVPLLEQGLQAFPDRVPVIQALADLRVKQGRVADAIALEQRLFALSPPSPAQLEQLGAMAMDAGQTTIAIDSFERARAAAGRGFRHDLELGVLYLDARRFDAAREALDRVPSSSPDYPMALFKRAQVSVLLHEPDAAARIDLAKKRADAVTRPLIEREKLFARQ